MIKTLFATFGTAIGIAAIIAIVVLFPFVFIWSINILFPMLAIPYTFETWLAIVLLQSFLKANVTIKK